MLNYQTWMSPEVNRCFEPLYGLCRHRTKVTEEGGQARSDREEEWEEGAEPNLVGKKQKRGRARSGREEEKEGVGSDLDRRRGREDRVKSDQKKKKRGSARARFGREEEDYDDDGDKKPASKSIIESADDAVSFLSEAAMLDVWQLLPQRLRHEVVLGINKSMQGD